MQNEDGPDDDYPSKKRQRVSKACDQCRRSKYKCDGEIPICQTCKKAHRGCTYGDSTRKRGLQSGYVRCLEALYGVILQSVGGSDKTMKALVLSHLDSRKTEAAETKDRHEEVESLVDHWKMSDVAKTIEKILVGEEYNEPEGAGLSTEDVRIVWALPVTRAITADQQVAIEDRSSIPADEVGNLNLTVRHVLSSNQATYDYSHPSIQRTLVSLPVNAQVLLNHYFELTHCWLPILERHELFRTLFSYPPSRLDVTQKSSGSAGHAVLWAVLAYESARNPGIPSYTGEPLCDSMFEIALGLIPSEHESSFNVRYVQAFLILGLTKFTARAWKAAWLLIGRAILIARALGIDSVDGPNPESSERVWMGCLVLDTIISAHNKRVPHLNPQAFIQQSVTPESGLEEWEPWKQVSGVLDREGHHELNYSGPAQSLSIFNRLVSLCQIMNSALSGTGSEIDLNNWLLKSSDFCKITAWEDLDIHYERFSMPHIINLRLTIYCCSNLVRQSTLTPSDLRPSQISELIGDMLAAMEFFVGTYGLTTRPVVFDLCILLAKQHLSQYEGVEYDRLSSRVEILSDVCEDNESNILNLPRPSDSDSGVHSRRNLPNPPYGQNLQSLGISDSIASPVAAYVVPEIASEDLNIDDPSSLLDTNSAFDYFMSLDIPDSGNDQSQFMLNLGYLDYLS